MTFLFDDLPWLRLVLSRFLGVAILWALLAFPAYLLLPLVQAIDARFAGFIELLSTRLAAFRSTRRDARFALRNLLLQDQAFRKAVTDKLTLWRVSLKHVRDPLDSLSGNLRGLSERVKQAGERLRLLEPGAAGAGPLPSVADLAQETLRGRAAWATLIVGLFLLLASMTVNIGMLGQILRDLEVVPEDVQFFSMNLASVFASLLTLLEAGMGYLFGIFGPVDPQTGRRRLTSASLAVLAGAVAIACVEGFFYSRIGASGGQSRAIFEVPGADLRITYETIFFLWGFVLVMALFGFGVAVHKAQDTVVHTGAGRSLRQRLRALTLSSGTWKESLGEVRSLLGETISQSAKTEDSLRAHHDRVGELRAAIDEVEKSESLESGKAAPLSAAEARLLEYRSLFWLLALGVGIVILVSVSRPRLLGVGLAVVFVAAGILLRSRVTEPLGVGTLARTSLQRWLAGIGLAAAIILGVLAFSGAGIRLLPMSVGLVMLFIGSELADIFGFASIHLRGLLDGFLGLAGLAALLVLHVCRFAVVAAKYAIAAIASPAAVILQRRRWHDG